MIKRFDFPPKRTVGYVQLTLSGKITFADLEYSRILRRPLEDLIGRYFIDLLAEDEQEFAVKRLKSLVRSKKTFQACKRYIDPVGQIIPVLTTAWIEYSPEGSPIGIGGADQAITDFGVDRLRASLAPAA